MQRRSPSWFRRLRRAPGAMQPARTAAWIVALVLLVAPLAPALASGGGGGGGIGGGTGDGGSAPTWKRSPEEIAAKSYEQGLRARDRALAYEVEAQEKDEPGFLGLGKPPSEKAIDQWHEAIGSYKKAIVSKADFYQAYSDLGFAYRKIGNYSQSLAAYDRALEIESGYTPAIEYRAEAYLKLGRLEDAKVAYGRLFREDRPLADQLMGAMKEWLGQVEGKPVEEVSADELKAFREWVEQRERLAAQVSGSDAVRRPW